MAENIGNFVPQRFVIPDLMQAIWTTHDLIQPCPQWMDPDMLLTVVETTREANQEQGRNMGYGATLGWGITIGVLAERNRVARVKSR